MLNQKILIKESGFTLVEIIAVLVILGLLAAVAVPRYVELEEHTRHKAIGAATSEINAREILTWAEAKISTSGFVSDAKIFGKINYELDPNYIWNLGDPTVAGGTLKFKGEFFTLSRSASTYLKAAVWKQK